MTRHGVSVVAGAGTILTSLVGFTLLYGVLAVLWFKLMKRYAIEGVAAGEKDPSPDGRSGDDSDAPLSFAY